MMEFFLILFLWFGFVSILYLLSVIRGNRGDED